MNVDCRHMQRTISDLHQEIADAMKLKFGRKVNIDDLEETILRRMVMKLRCDMLDIGSEYVKESKMLSVSDIIVVIHVRLFTFTLAPILLNYLRVLGTIY